MTKAHAYSEADVKEKLKGLPGWWLESGWIRRAYKTDGWPSTLMLVNAIGYAAQVIDHHPDLEVAWGGIVVKSMTHSAGGVTDKDFELARKIEDLALGTGHKFVQSGDRK